MNYKTHRLVTIERVLTQASIFTNEVISDNCVKMMTHADIGSIALAEIAILHVCHNMILCGNYASHNCVGLQISMEDSKTVNVGLCHKIALGVG